MKNRLQIPIEKWNPPTFHPLGIPVPINEQSSSGNSDTALAIVAIMMVVAGFIALCALLFL